MQGRYTFVRNILDLLQPMLIGECNRSFVYISCTVINATRRFTVVSLSLVAIPLKLCTRLALLDRKYRMYIKNRKWATRIAWRFRNETHRLRRFMRRRVICVLCVVSKVLTIPVCRHTFKTLVKNDSNWYFSDGQGRSDIIAGFGGCHSCTSFISSSFTLSSHIVSRTGSSLHDEFTRL